MSTFISGGGVTFATVNAALASANADVSINNQKITNVAAPSTSGEASTKGYVDGKYFYFPIHFSLSLSGTSSSAAWVPTGASAELSTQSTIYPEPIGVACEIVKINVTAQAVGTTASSGALRYEFWTGASGSAVASGTTHDHNITSLSSNTTFGTPLSLSANSVLSLKQAATGSVLTGQVRVRIVALARVPLI